MSPKPAVGVLLLWFLAVLVVGCASDLPPSQYPKRNLFGGAVVGYVATGDAEEKCRKAFLNKFPEGTRVDALVDYVEGEGGECRGMNGPRDSGEYQCIYRDVFVVAVGGMLQEPDAFYEVTHNWTLRVPIERGLLQDVSASVDEETVPIRRDEFVARARSVD